MTGAVFHGLNQKYYYWSYEGGLYDTIDSLTNWQRLRYFPTWSAHYVCRIYIVMRDLGHKSSEWLSKLNFSLSYSICRLFKTAAVITMRCKVEVLLYLLPFYHKYDVLWHKRAVFMLVTVFVFSNLIRTNSQLKWGKTAFKLIWNQRTKTAQ